MTRAGDAGTVRWDGAIRRGECGHEGSVGLRRHPVPARRGSGLRTDRPGAIRRLGRDAARWDGRSLRTTQHPGGLPQRRRDRPSARPGRSRIAARSISAHATALLAGGCGPYQRGARPGRLRSVGETSGRQGRPRQPAGLRGAGSRVTRDSSASCVCERHHVSRFEARSYGGAAPVARTLRSGEDKRP